MSRRTLWRPFAGLFAALATAACGGALHGATADAGTDAGATDAAAPQSFAGADASGSSPIDASIEQNDVTVAIITLTCAGACADIEAVATGGHPPYTFAWDDGSTDPMRHVCPNSSTRYAVQVTDTSAAGEFGRPAETAQASLMASVIGCLDGGVSDAGRSDSGVGACDSVTNVSPSGANPYGAWSYGSSASLGAAFSRYAEFVPASANDIGVDIWTSGGADMNPGAYFNPTANVIVYSTLSAQAGQFFLHPGPAGEYSLARWTASRPGAYLAVSAFEGIDVGPTTTDVHVQHDGVDVASGFINLNGGGNTFQSNLTVVVSAGDTIDFAVGNGGNGYTSDSTALSATVCSAGPGDGG